MTRIAGEHWLRTVRLPNWAYEPVAGLCRETQYYSVQ